MIWSLCCKCLSKKRKEANDDDVTRLIFHQHKYFVIINRDSGPLPTNTMMVSSLLLAVVTAFLVGPAASFPIVSYRPSQSLHNSYNPHNTNNIIIIMSSMSSTDDTTSRTRTKTSLTATNNNDAVQSEEPHVETILFVECGT